MRKKLTRVAEKNQNSKQPVAAATNQQAVGSSGDNDGQMAILGYHYDQSDLQKTTEISLAARQVIEGSDGEIKAHSVESSHELATPIKLYGKTIGVLGLEAPEGEVWSDEEISFLEEVSDQVALAIENARLIHQTQTQAKELSFLFTASKYLSETTEIPSIYSILINQLLNYLQAERCGVALIDKQRAHLQGLVEKKRSTNNTFVSHEQLWVENFQEEALQRLVHDPQPLVERIEATAANLSPRHERQQAQKIRTLVTIPLFARNQFTGVLEIGHQEANRLYGKNEWQFVEAILAQVTVAIENAQQFQKTEEALAETQKLYHISRALVETGNIEDIFQVVLDNVKEYELDRVSLSLLDTSEGASGVQAVKIIASWDRESNQILPVGSKISADMFPLVQASAKPPFRPIISEDLSKAEGQDPRIDEAFRRLMYEGLGAVTMFSTPMFLGTQYKGVLSISTRTAHTYEEQEQRVYQTLADQTIIAIENRRLFEQTKATLIITENQARQLSLLNEMSQKLNQIDSETDIFVIAAQQVNQVFAGDHSSVAIVNETKASLAILALQGNDVIPLGTDLPLLSSLAGDVVQYGRTIIVNDLETDPRRLTHYDLKTLAEQGLQAAMSAPLTVQGQIIGTISVGSNQLNAFSSHNEGLFNQSASIISARLENYRLFETIRYERDQAELLFHMDQELNQASTISEAQHIILALADELGTKHAEVYITDRQDLSRLVTNIPERNNVMILTTEELAEKGLSADLEAQAMQTQKTIVYLQEDRQLSFESWPSLKDVKAMIALPFTTKHSSLRGVLTFLYQDAEFFSKKRITILESFANQAGSIMENLWLLEQTGAALSETELLYDAARDFNKAQHPEELLRVLADSVVARDSLIEMGIDNMAISLIGEASQTTPIQNLTISARWTRADHAQPINEIVMSVEDYPFLAEISSYEPRTYNYSELDPETQTIIDERFGQAQSILIIPLRAGYNWLGLLFLTSSKANFVFRHSLITQLITLAGQVAVVIQNLQLIEETQKTLYNSETLSQLGEDLLIADTIEAIYDFSLKALAATEPGQGMAIIRYSRLNGYVEADVVAARSSTHEKSAPPDTTIPVKQDQLELISYLSAGQSVIVSDIKNDERFSTEFKKFMMAYGTVSFVAIPLWSKKEIDGFLLVSHAEPQGFSLDLIRLYEDVARQMSRALENKYLFEEAQYRATLLQTAAEVSQTATEYLDLTTLLSESVNLIRDRFNFYHVSIFLIDEYKTNAVIKASTGEVGQKMLETGHKLAIGGRSIVGTATATHKAHIALDVGEDGIHFKNPLLPDTRSEMALPLIARAELIGALDVQSIKKGAFQDIDITILQTMADQLANAIAAALAAQETQDTLEHMRKLNEYYLREEWGKFNRESDTLFGYQLTEDGFTKLTKDLQPEIMEAMELRQSVIILTDDDDTPKKNQKIPVTHTKSNDTILDLSLALSDQQESSSLVKFVTPLSLQNEVIIGVLDFDIPGQDRLWKNNNLQIIEAVTTQAAQAIEAARLFAETQSAREEAEALYRLGRALVTAENEEEMYQVVLLELLTTLGLGQGGVLFFDHSQKTGRLVALYQNNQPVEAGQIYPIEGNASYDQLITTKKPVAIEDVHTDPRLIAVREIYNPLNMESLLLVPIIINDKVVGALGADSVERRHVFTDREINLTSAMADQFSIVLQNRWLLEETNRRALQLQATADVGQVATSILDQDLMLNKAVELIQDRFGFYYIQIFLVDKKGRLARLHKATGQTGEKLLASKYKVVVGSANIVGRVMSQRQSIVIRSETDADDFKPSLYQDYLPQSKAELAIPLLVGDTLTGILDLHSTNQNAFSPDEIPIFETLAAQLAIATENARAFREQQETAERLKEIDKLKTQFLANMSHELRTPLNSIIGFSRVILKGIDGPLTELQKTDLTSIHNSGQHLLGLINNILDLSKIEAGKMELNFEEVEVEPIIKSVMATAIALVKDKPVTLHQDLEENLPVLWADPTRIRQITLNLISNACKFTDEGAVTLYATADSQEIRISVKDTGVGIPEDKLESVFEEFTQVDASTTRKAGGTGLGLPISRHFVDMHNGKIWVESTAGEGATFSFTIPLKRADLKTTTPFEKLVSSENKERTEKKVIVAIDDDADVVQLYERYLEPQGYEVVGISSSHDIVDQVKQLAPAAILLDVLMPDRDGWSVIRDLNDDPDTENIPVIICSIVSDKKQGFSLGAAGYMTKPITENDLLRALGHLKNRDKMKKVLVIDDEADDILLIRRMLESQPNYSVIATRSGKEGLQLAKKDPPDLVILDLSMPEIDGFGVVEALKNDEATRTVPIVIVSAKDLTHQEDEFLTGQVEALLRKGIFTENELLEDVQQALSHIHQKEIINL